MEPAYCESSSVMVKAQLQQTSKKSIKSNQICPIELLEKELDVEHGTTNYKHETHQITVPTDAVFLPNKEAKKTTQTIIHVRPVFSLGTFLKTVELVGDDAPSFQVNKVRSFPTSIYQFSDSANPLSTFELTSNFIGSKYHLRKEGITYLTVSFHVGCGNRCRHLDIFTLREKSHWDSLQGINACADLQQLYSKGNNYQHISRLTNLEPTISRSGEAILRFSRRAVVPCVQNMILCNLNGQKVLEMVKINELDDLFEVSMQRKMDVEKLLAILVASFDFKLGLE